MKIKHSSRRLSLAILAAVLGVQSLTVQAQTQTATNEDLPTLIKRIDELEQKLKIVERNREVDQETTATKAKDAASVSLGVNGLIVRSADSNFLMDIHGYAQADARFYLGKKTTTDTFLLRRVRPIVEGTVWKQFDYRLMADFGTGNVTGSSANNVAVLDDAYVNARVAKQFQIQVGKYKSPVGLERLQSTAELNLIETGFATALTPNYDLGASIHNSYFDTPLGYSIGIYNGAIDGGSDDLDTTDEGKDVVARLFAQPFLNTDIAPLKRLGFGVGGSYGDHTGVLPSYKTPGQQTFFAYAAGVTASGEQYRVDPQAYWYWGPFGGRGVLLGGVPGVAPARVTILGGGTVGAHAAEVALGFGAQVCVLEQSQRRMYELQARFGARLQTLYASEDNLTRCLAQSELVIGAVLVPGAAAPKLIRREHLSAMLPGSVLVDVAVDQGGCAETTRPTTHLDPVFEVSGVQHYCVANMPAAVSRTATLALTGATLPYGRMLASLGLDRAIAARPELGPGLTTRAGRLLNAAVAQSFERRAA